MTARAWTEQEIATLIERTTAGDPISALAEELERTEVAIVVKQRKLGLHKMTPRQRQETCAIDGCDRPHYAIGRCNLHYVRMNRQRRRMGAGL